MNISRREFLGFLGALGLTACARVKVPLIGGGDQGPFIVAALNDLHLLDARSMGIVNHAVDRINAVEGLRFTVVLGDVTSSAKLAEFNLAKDSLSRLQRPYFVVPGNHDLEPGENPRANFEKTFGVGHWVREEADWVFIGLDSCQGTSSDVTIQQDQLDWLRKQIRKIKPTRPIALLSHHPFNPHTKKYRVKNADAVLGMFAGHNLKLVAAGHWHGNQVEEQNGILFVTTACCSSTRDNFDDTTAKGYRLFYFDKDAVKTAFVTVST